MLEEDQQPADLRPLHELGGLLDALILEAGEDLLGHHLAERRGVRCNRRRRAMATVISGTFPDRSAAQEAVERLRAAGVPTADISMIVRDAETRGKSPVTDTDVRSRT